MLQFVFKREKLKDKQKKKQKLPIDKQNKLNPVNNIEGVRKCLVFAICFSLSVNLIIRLIHFNF